MIKPGLLVKLQRLVERQEEVHVLLAEPSVIAQQDLFRKLSREEAELQPVVSAWEGWQHLLQAREETQQLSKESEFREMALAELADIDHRLQVTEDCLLATMLPRDPRDEASIFLEVRAGTGGDEAAIFAGDLFRMYSRYAERQGWQVEIVSASEGEHGGFKEVIAEVRGRSIFAKLKFESGVHRVQRVPETEAQGRVHTSACTVAILPVQEEITQIDINPADLRIDTYRSSGAGGQHVNKTDSAIRITHIPTGTVVECQDERSQHKNKARAMSLLAARLLAREQEAQQTATASLRRDLVGTGDRSERIRTYNFPQGRLTDHRINLTLYSLQQVMDGDLGEVIEALLREHQTDQLTALAEN